MQRPYIKYILMCSPKKVQIMRTKKLSHIILFLVAIPTLLVAQQLNQINISGIVTDSISNKPVAGVFVESFNEADTTEKASGFSDADGRYVLKLETSQDLDYGSNIPSGYRLFQNYPNPFNPTTRIIFQIPKESQIHLVIYDILGQKIRTLVDQHFEVGTFSAEWDGRNDAGIGVAAGIYFYQLRTKDFIETRKMILLDGTFGKSSPVTPSLLINKERSLPLLKSNELLLTIRYTAPFITTSEFRHVSLSTENYYFNITVNFHSGSVLNRESVVISDPGADGKVYISGLTGVVKNTDSGTEKINAVNMRSNEVVSIRVNYDGSFSLMSLDGIVGDSLSITLSRDGMPVGYPESFKVEMQKKPVVVGSKPTNGDKDIILGAIIFVMFSESMDENTITDNTLFLTDGSGNHVAGTIGFLDDNTIASFNPDQNLAPFTTYTITVTTGVSDWQGIQSGSIFTAIFTTGTQPDFWEPTNGPFGDDSVKADILGLAINSSGHIFAAAGLNGFGIFRSIDNGDTWIKVCDTITSSLAINSNGDIFAGSGEGYGRLLRSTDNGDTWSPASNGITAIYILSLAINSDDHIFTGTVYDGVFRSTDNGDTWLPINKGLPNSSSVQALTINTNDDIFAGTISEGIFRSTDNGNTWTPINNGMTSYRDVFALTINSTGDIFAGTTELDSGGVIRSTDNGDIWSNVYHLSDYDKNLRALVFNSDQVLFAGIYALGDSIGGSVLRSTDNGNTWTPINAGMTTQGIWALAINSSGYIFAGTIDGVFRSLQTTTSLQHVSGEAPKDFILAPNYPNPFNPYTKITFIIPKPEYVTIEVHNIIGQKIKSFLNRQMSAGNHEVEFNGQNLSAGIYFYKIEAGDIQDVKKMVLLR